MNENKQVAVITGGASGIGLALAKACLLRNMQVVIADNATRTLSEAVHTLSQTSDNKVLGVQCDVGQLNEVERLAEQTIAHFGHVNLLINNAGISGRLAPIWELRAEEIKKVMTVNLEGTIHGIQTFLPHLCKQSHRSHIVNMASVYALCSGSYMSAYAASKHAVLALSESLFFELRQFNRPVDVSVIFPSFANTNLITNSIENSSDEFGNMVASLIERSRPAEDVAEYILREIEKKTFYILPDKEVKNYCEQRLSSIQEELIPYEHNLEKVIAKLSKRAMNASQQKG